MAVHPQARSWTRSWVLDAQTCDNDGDQFEFVDAADATSDYGVESLTDALYSPSVISELLLPRAVMDSMYQIEKHTITDEAGDEKDCTVSRADAIAHELSGRRNDGHKFQDLRSGGKSRNRVRATSEKYWGFREVKRGALGKPHHVQDWYSYHPHLRGPLPDVPVEAMTKKMMFDDAQKDPPLPIWPPAHIIKAHHDLWGASASRRLNARKHAARMARADLEDDLDEVELYQIREEAAEECDSWNVELAVEESLREARNAEEVQEPSAADECHAGAEPCSAGHVPGGCESGSSDRDVG